MPSPFGVFTNIIKDASGFAPPLAGGSVGAMFGSFAYNTTGIGSGITLFTLPYNAKIISQLLYITTAFNAGTTNTLDFGTTGALTQFCAAAAAGSTGIFNGVFALGQFASALAADIPYTVKYNQTGTAASAGAGLVVVLYTL